VEEWTGPHGVQIVSFGRRETCIVGQGSPQARLRRARLGLTRNQLFTKQRRKMNMAKIINFPNLCKLTEHQKNELVVQVLEIREKMNSIVDLICDQEQTNDLRQRLYNEMMAVESMMTNADELLRRLTAGKNDSV
jgi:hypothetical protein